MNHRDKLLHGSFGDSIRPPEDKLEVAHGAHDHDGDGEVQKKGEGPKAFKPNATMYLRSIKAPERADEIRRHGCTGWPCHAGYLCDFCMLRPEWIAESKLEPLMEEVHSLKQTVVQLRKQQADVETLKKAERLVEGKHWSSEQDSRISTLNSMLEDSRARLQAQEASARQVAAETVRDSLLEQLTTLQNRLESKERDLTTSHQKVEALSESLATAQYSLRFNNDELAEKRKILSDAIKEKSRFRDLARKLELTIEAQNHELVVRGEQTKALILELERLQGIEGQKNRFEGLAEERAHIAQSIMDAVSEDIIMAERMRDEKAHQLRKQQREIQNKNKTLASQNNMMAKVRAELTETKTKLEQAAAREHFLQSKSRGGSRRSSSVTPGAASRSHTK